MITFWSVVFGLVTMATGAQQPNILLVVADDYGWNDIGYHGSEIKTPNLDKLAAEGVKLENYYIQPICTPSRSQLMSGRYQIHTGLQHGVIHPDVPNGLPLDIPTMADKLKEAGYSTHIVGKWHLGFFKKEYTPTQRGFESFFGYFTGEEDYFTHIILNGYDLHENERNADQFKGQYSADFFSQRIQNVTQHHAKQGNRYYTGEEDYFEHVNCEGGCGYDLHDNWENADQYKGQYSAYLFNDRIQKIATEYAQNSRDKPLFLYAPFQSVHAPLEVPEQYEKQYKHIDNVARRKYAGMVSAMDEAIGNITNTYKELGLWDNTIMVFSTDNGGQVHAGGNNYPLRGWKGSLWEGGVHGVGFVSGGALKQSAKGTSSRELFHITDWFPTLLGLAGGTTSGLKLDGYDVWSAISDGDKSPRKELLHNIDPLTDPIGKPYPHSRFDTRNRAAIRVGDYKLITGDPGESGWIPPPSVDYDPVLAELGDLTSIRHATFPDTKLRFHAKEQQNVWLFNIKEDPNEHKDLSDQMPALVEDMLNRLADYNATAVPCRYPDPDPKANPDLHGGYWVPWE